MAVDDELKLSEHSLMALQEFLAEQKEHLTKFEALKKDVDQLDMEMFTEDWNLSQFWYDQQTRTFLAQKALSHSPKTVGCLSSPSVYLALRKMNPEATCVVFEFDKRFNAFGDDFVFYDFNNPVDIDSKWKSKFDVLVVDPPFLSDECWSKVSQTVRWLTHDSSKLIICTGKVMASKIKQELGCIETKFKPQHTNGLQNEFWCFSNFDF